MQAAVRIVLVDDHKLVRAGIRALLQQVGGVEVIGEADDGRDGVEVTERLRPDVVFMDISMKGLNGIDATAQLRRRNAEVKIIMLSMHAAEEQVTAIEAVLRGELYVSPAVSRGIVDRLLRSAPGTPSPLSLLTPRQKEILQLIAEGRSTKEIAHRLGLSVKTVETHRAQLMQRIGIRDVPGLVRYALRSGLIQAD
jgi:DNA-binding NarL/FixJ family response regulator